MREPRLGDDIDDFCVRCKRVMNHAVVSIINAEPAKVRCRTCHSDHDFRREQPPPPKVDPRKQALFNDVLKKVDPTAEPVQGPALEDPLVEDTAEEIDTVEEAAIAEEAPVAEEPVIKAAPKPKTKARRK